MSNKEQKTFREMFNQMADKRVNFGEYYQNWKEEIADLSVLEKIRLYGGDYPMAIYAGLFVKGSDEKKRLDKTDLYYRSRGANDRSLFPDTEDIVITKDWMVATEMQCFDIDAVPSNFRAKIVEATIRAWNKAEDRSDEILKGNYRAKIHKSPR
ncbi:MAG: hypothetical protein NZ828_01190 [Alphaproteobacteria bacterium]|nr:hypothetical protein [Alphaproteobacteria bacterium]